jgi:hypothetical protein
MQRQRRAAPIAREALVFGEFVECFPERCWGTGLFTERNGGIMFDQFLETFRRASESSMQIQQDMVKQWSQQFFTAPPGVSTEWGRQFQKRCMDFTLEILNKHRESIDAGYKAGIQAIEEIFRTSDAKSPDDYRRTAEDVWRKLFDTFRTQYETQLQEFQKFTSMSFEMAQRPQS